MLLFIIDLILLVFLFILFILELLFEVDIEVLTTFFSTWVWVLGCSVLTIFLIILVVFCESSFIDGVWLYLIFSKIAFEGALQLLPLDKLSKVILIKRSAYIISLINYKIYFFNSLDFFNSFYWVIYLAVWDLRYNTQDPCCILRNLSLWHTDSLVAPNGFS